MPVRALIFDHALIDRSRGRLRLAIATSSPKKFTDVLLPALGVANAFEVVQTGDDGRHGKPDPEMYLTCMGRLGVASGEVVVLEDAAAGAVAGKRAGAYVIAVPTHLTAGEDFSFADARAADLFDAARQLDVLAEAENGGFSRVGREGSFFWQKCNSVRTTTDEGGRIVPAGQE